jgi:hypothetical protein
MTIVQLGFGDEKYQINALFLKGFELCFYLFDLSTPTKQNKKD